MNCSVGLQSFCVAWIVPAVALAWTGLGAVGLRVADDAAVAVAIDRIQALTVLLAIFTVIVGAIWAVRTWGRAPSLGSGRRLLPGGSVHLVALLVALIAICGATAAPELADALTPIAAVSAFCAGLVLPRLLLLAPIGQTVPAVTLATVVTYQLTMGWLHSIYPTAGLSWLLVVEGLLLAWAATAAARVVAGAGLRSRFGLPADSIGVAVESSLAHNLESTVDLVNQAPALPSLPGPAVGR